MESILGLYILNSQFKVSVLKKKSVPLIHILPDRHIQDRQFCGEMITFFVFTFLMIPQLLKGKTDFLYHRIACLISDLLPNEIQWQFWLKTC